MVAVRKGANAQRWISFDGKQTNLSEVVAVVSTIKGAQIETKAGITRIYIPKRTTSSASFRTTNVWRKGKAASVKRRKEQPKGKHYCAIMLK